MKLLFYCLMVAIAVVIMGCPDNGAVAPMVEDVGEMVTEGDQISGVDILPEEEYHISAREFESAVTNQTILVFADATSAM